MSSNLSVINFAVGGTLTTTGKTTLGDTLLSSSSASFQGLSTTNLIVLGTSTFNNSLPTSIQNPTLDAELTTKIYVDNADTNLDKRITDNDTAVRIYIDGSYNTLNTRITNVDTSRKTYIDEADTALDSRITNVDASRKTYIDEADTALDSRITNVDASRKTYIDNADTALRNSITNIGIKPLFYVHQNSNNTQTIPNNAMTKVSYSAVLYNVLNKYLNGESNFSGFSYGGFYQMNASVCLPNITGGYIAIFKNGVEYSRGSSFSSNTTSADTTLTVSTLIYMNGTQSGDLCDCRVICSPSTVISGSQSKTFFTGHFIQS
jgi:hypothetical protein